MKMKTAKKKKESLHRDILVADFSSENEKQVQLNDIFKVLKRKTKMNHQMKFKIKLKYSSTLKAKDIFRQRETTQVHC